MMWLRARLTRDWEFAGYTAAALAVVIWASYPVATRAGVTSHFAPQDLVLLRFGIGALIFLPYVVFHFSSIRPNAWLRGAALALFQGAGMAALVIFGLRYAPASHAAALGPGVAPAWVALLGFLVFSQRPSARMLIGATFCVVGVIVLTSWSASLSNAAVLTGDAMFVVASGLGALYVLQIRNWGIGAMQGAAIVTLYSAAIVIPWYLWSASATLWQVAQRDLLWQILWQGVLIGCVALIALNLAIGRLGAERSSALVALVPALSAVLGLLFLGESPSVVEIAGILAISTGVFVGAWRPTGVDLPRVARPQSDRPVGYPVRDSVP